MRSRIITVAALFAALLFVTSQALAAAKEGGKKRTPSVVGTVAVTKEKVKDDKGVETEAIKSITITSTKKTETTVYNVVLGKSVEMDKTVAGFDTKKVKATGTIEEKDGSKWITVATCEEYVPKPKKQ